MSNKLEELDQKLHETQSLLEAMMMELRFRGCDDSHKLVTQAQDLGKWLDRYNRLNRRG